MTDYNNDIELGIRVLNAGGLILYPTDTVWGIGCDATNEQAVKKIYDLKKRSDNKAMIVLVADSKAILKYTSQPDLSVIAYLKTKSKPTTVIYEGAIGLAANVVAADGSVAIRITSDIFCKHLIKRFRKPIVSTSANITGSPPPVSFIHIIEDIKKGVDYIVRYRQEDNNPACPSTVIQWKNGKEMVIRE